VKQYGGTKNGQKEFRITKGKVFSLFKRALWLMQLKHLEMFAFKTYLGAYTYFIP
jgi:hypothetical protein